MSVNSFKSYIEQKLSKKGYSIVNLSFQHIFYIVVKLLLQLVIIIIFFMSIIDI